MTLGFKVKFTEANFWGKISSTC